MLKPTIIHFSTLNKTWNLRNSKNYKRNLFQLAQTLRRVKDDFGSTEISPANGPSFYPHQNHPLYLKRMTTTGIRKRSQEVKLHALRRIRLDHQCEWRSYRSYQAQTATVEKNTKTISTHQLVQATWFHTTANHTNTLLRTDENLYQEHHCDFRRHHHRNYSQVNGKELQTKVRIYVAPALHK